MLLPSETCRYRARVPCVSVFSAIVTVFWIHDNNAHVTIEDVHMYDFETYVIDMIYFSDLNFKIGPSSTVAFLKG